METTGWITEMKRVEAPRRGRDGFVHTVCVASQGWMPRRSACRWRCKPNEAVGRCKIGGLAAWLAAQCHRKSTEACVEMC